MRYIIYCNQKNISDNHQQAILEFKKRLSAYCETDLILSSTLHLDKNISKSNHQILFVSNGPSKFSSEEFASYIHNIQLTGKSNLHILIGYDLTDLYTNTPSDLLPPDSLSITKFDLSHETVTLLFYEQLYRAYTILQGKTYHK
ncbi:MAG: 23S rRNA (pseudouridine(1915)-N(3))-methyltransferase RlmH [Eubacteriales bacterium]|nr:23S rRNA (pseudouridine(1915)-N(3))-methyltransferase RlmH [Eubacteriales bacterium]